MSEKQEQFIQLPIEWSFPNDLINRYANNMIVQHTSHEFIVSFFETIPPLVFGKSIEQEKQSETLKSVRSTCVARLIIHPERMGEFIQALHMNYQNYLSKNTDEETEA